MADPTTLPSSPLTPAEIQALGHLITLAQGHSGQSRRAADFLLAWWNGASYDHFELTTLWGVDDDIAADMCTRFGPVARIHRYPDTLGYGERFKAIVQAWRLELLE